MYSIQSDCRGSDPCILPFWTEALEKMARSTDTHTYTSCTVNLPKSGCACIKKNCCGLGGGLSRTKIRSGTRCARQFWPQGARSAASALARSQRNGRLPARAHASIKIGARIQSEFRIQIMHA